MNFIFIIKAKKKIKKEKGQKEMDYRRLLIRNSKEMGLFIIEEIWTGVSKIFGGARI